MEMVTRNLGPWLDELLTATPILVLEGARQVGKSTLAHAMNEGAAVFTTMDDEVTRTFAAEDPQTFLQLAGDQRLVIDEIQRCPALILPLKAEVDRLRHPGRFVLTGSANLLRLPGASDSLAGRAMTVRVHPFTQGELLGLTDDWVTAVLHQGLPPSAALDRLAAAEMVTTGGYPPVQDLTPKVRSAWLRDYTDRLVERDSTDLGQTQLPILRRLLNLIAAAPGSEIVLDRFATALGISRSTVQRYLDILEALFFIQPLPSWSRNLTSRQVKRSKFYLNDSGLVSCLMNLAAPHLASPHGADHFGPLVENFVVNELTRQRGWSETDFTLSHYRDRTGAEVDLVIDTPQGVIGVEVKATGGIRADHFKHLKDMRDRLGQEFIAGIVLHLGPTQQAGDRLWAHPLSSLWQQ